jgi:hypothetical protein
MSSANGQGCEFNQERRNDPKKTVDVARRSNKQVPARVIIPTATTDIRRRRFATRRQAIKTGDRP